MQPIINPAVDYMRKLLGGKSFLPDQAVQMGKHLVFPTGGFWPHFITLPDQTLGGLVKIYHQVSKSTKVTSTDVVVQLPDPLMRNFLHMFEEHLKRTSPLTLLDMVFKMPMMASTRTNNLIGLETNDIKIRPKFDIEIETVNGLTSFTSTRIDGLQKIQVAVIYRHGYKIATLQIETPTISGVGGSLLETKTAQDWADVFLYNAKIGNVISANPECGGRALFRPHSYSPQFVWMVNNIAKQIAEIREERYEFIPYEEPTQKPSAPSKPSVPPTPPVVTVPPAPPTVPPPMVPPIAPPPPTLPPSNIPPIK